MSNNHDDETGHDDEAGRVPDWLLERWVAGDLPPARARAIEVRLAREPGGRERLAALGASNREILAAHPAEAVVEAVRRRAAEAGARPAAREARRSGWLLALPTAALATAAVLVVVRGGGPRPPAPNDDEHIKGTSSGPSLHVYRKAGRTIERLADGAAARAGDELQLAYVARGRRFGAVLSLDGAGRITFHLPEGGGRATPLQAGGEVTLPQSYELDAAPRFERFLLVTADAPFDTAGLADVLRGTRPPPPGTDTVTFTVRKE